MVFSLLHVDVLPQALQIEAFLNVCTACYCHFDDELSCFTFGLEDEKNLKKVTYTIVLLLNCDSDKKNKELWRRKAGSTPDDHAFKGKCLFVVLQGCKVTMIEKKTL